MNYYAHYNNDGFIFSVSVDRLMYSGENVICLGENKINSSEYYVTNSTLTLLPIKPSELHTFNYATHAWEFDCDLCLAATRYSRDQHLKESDWTVLPDSPLTAQKRAEWIRYRQALRDAPSNCLTSGWSMPVAPLP